MDDTRTALLGKFREEVDTHLLRLSQGVVALEQDPGNTGLLKEVFRSAHTIKGAAKMMGFAEITRITHEMESVLGVMRDGHLQLTSDISDLLFEGVDAITLLTQLQTSPGDAQATEALAEMNPDQLVARLKAIADSAAPAAKEAPAPAPLPVAPSVAGASNGTTAALDHAEAAPPVAPYEAGPASRGEAHAARADLTGFKPGEDSIRVRVQKLDTLMNLSGEMVITKMQHEAIAAQIRTLLELERNRARFLADMRERVERSWGMINQVDMEEALEQLHALDTTIDDQTGSALREFQEYAGRLNSISDELQDTVLSVRMLPIETIFSTFPRAVRDFKRESGKDVEVLVRGGETELDKQILESLGDPLIHLLRNALDHGIESPAQRRAAGKPTQGLVTVHAYAQGTQVLIEVSDDGAGMDPATIRRLAVQKNYISRLDAEKLSDEESLNLIFYPGFSTASIITEVSGRGVGMDVVKSTVERMNGTVGIESQLGMGTRVTLRLPLTLATMQALLVRVGTQVFVVPSHTVEGGMEYIGLEDIFMVEGHEVVRLKGRSMPLVRLADLLDLRRVESGTWLKDTGLQHLLHTPRPASSNGHGPLDGEEEDLSLNFRAPVLGTGIRLENKLPGVIVGSGDRQACFLVDELIDELDVVVKNLGPLLSKVETAIGATILGNGRVVVILDMPSLLAEARNLSTRGQLGRAWQVAKAAKKPRILVVDDSITTRELEKSILENAGYEVEIAMDGLEALGKLEQQLQDGEQRYDLVIADIEMPRMDGLEMTQRVKSHQQDMLRNTPVIIVSSLASDAYKQRGIEVGAQAYITKGQFDQSHLLETIDLLIQ
jgi:two-component system chemotaxis sensor kinase CheA